MGITIIIDTSPSKYSNADLGVSPSTKFLTFLYTIPWIENPSFGIVEDIHVIRAIDKGITFQVENLELETNICKP